MEKNTLKEEIIGKTKKLRISQIEEAGKDIFKNIELNEKEVK